MKKLTATLLTLTIIAIISIATYASSSDTKVINTSNISLVQSSTPFVGAGGMAGAISGSAGSNIKVAQY